MGQVRELPVYKNGEVICHALVDEQDYEFLSRHQWHVAENRGKPYVALTMGRRFVFLHRLVYGWIDNIQHIDHINGNVLDNRRENLRAVSIRENLRNRGKTKVSQNPYKGITLSTKKHGKWCASIGATPLRVGLGTWNTAEEAAMAYDHAARLLHGDHAWLNFPDTEASPKIAHYVEAAIERARARQK